MLKNKKRTELLADPVLKTKNRINKLLILCDKALY